MFVTLYKVIIKGKVLLVNTFTSIRAKEKPVFLPAFYMRHSINVVKGLTTYGIMNIRGQETRWYLNNRIGATMDDTNVYVERRYGLRWKRIGTYVKSNGGYSIVTADHPTYWVAEPCLEGTAWYLSPEDREAWHDEIEFEHNKSGLTNKESKVVTCYVERDAVVRVSEVTTTRKNVISWGEISEEWVS